MKNDIYDMIEKEDLTPDLRMMANVCGMEPVRIMLRAFPAQSFYFPKITRFDSFIRRFIAMHSDKTYSQIALMLGASQQYVKQQARSRFN
jgi:hypothetical protein